MLLDCGLMFPDESCPASTRSCPTSADLDENGRQIIGVICTHGHEDHIGALATLLKRFSFPDHTVRRSPSDMAKSRIDEAGVTGPDQLNPVADGEKRSIGRFDWSSCRSPTASHTVSITAFDTPQGVILHSSDFKLDLTPVDGRLTDLARIGAMANDDGHPAVRCATPPTPTSRASRPRSRDRPVLQDCSARTSGQRIIVASFASHIHRVQQIADAAIANGRDRRHARSCR